MLIPITNIQRFCMHDGPGVRTTVFLKGCPLRCQWCHNPETQSAMQEILFYEKKCIHCGACETVCPNGAQKVVPKRIYDREKCNKFGKCVQACSREALSFALNEMQLEEVITVVEKDRAFYGKNGGITISGGEPMFHPKETLALLAACKEKGIGTAVETCGYFEPRYLPELVKLTDVFLWDLKDINDARHKQYTGVSNQKILENLYEADRLGAKIILRCIMVNGVNMEENHYRGIAEVYQKLSGCIKVELFPYHIYGASKAQAIGRTDKGREEWIPQSGQMEEAKNIIRRLRIFNHF